MTRECLALDNRILKKLFDIRNNNDNINICKYTNMSQKKKVELGISYMYM